MDSQHFDAEIKEVGFPIESTLTSPKLSLEIFLEDIKPADGEKFQFEHQAKTNFTALWISRTSGQKMEGSKRKVVPLLVVESTFRFFLYCQDFNAKMKVLYFSITSSSTGPELVLLFEKLMGEMKHILTKDYQFEYRKISI